MTSTRQTFRYGLLAVLAALTMGTPQPASSQAGTRAGVSNGRSAQGEDVQSSEARGTRSTREMNARGSVLGTEEHADVEDQERRDLTDDPDRDSVDEHTVSADGEEQEEEGQEPKDLPGAQEGNSSVTPQAISLPNAEGSIEGMGESFSPVLSSGTATFSVPIALPAGRAGVQPSLGLSYSSTNGNGVVGIGWGMGAPFISRQTDRGLPRYDDREAWHAREDRFIYNGGQELVPVDSELMARVDASGLYDLSIAAAVPDDVAGWQQYRARVEGGFMRFFRSPDGRRWVVQGKDGTRFDFGELPAMTGPNDLDSTFSLQSELGNGRGRIFMWHLTRMSDAHGSTVYYQYGEHLGVNYLEDVYYVSPASCAEDGLPVAQRECRAPLRQYAAHVAIRYDTNRPDRFSSYTTGWRTELTRRVRMITVTMAEAEVGTRYLVRRYHLSYDGRVHHSLLASVQVEGRPDAPLTQAPPGVVAVTPGTMVPEGNLDDFGTRVGRLLPPMTFEYTGMPEGSVAGFGGVDNTVIDVPFGPDVSVDLADADLYDVNTDGLPDVVVTEPARYRTRDGSPAAGVFFNGFEGDTTEPAGRAGVFSEPVPVPMRGDLSGVMRMRNANIVPMDVDGDGRGDLLHMPRLHSYGYFTPTREADETVGYSVRPADQGWRFTYAEVQLDRVGDDPRIDLVRDGTHYKMWDVNNDHLVDVVRTTGTVMQTWINLGWAPGGEGRFGQATFDEGRGAWELSSEPIETCLLHDGTPVDFSDPELRLADMNGDGIEDIVRIRRGRLVYWAGRGEALWGDGPATCDRNQGANRERHMESAPPELNPDLSGVFMADINADGLSDVVQVRYNQLDVWFNVNGERFTPRQTFASPFAPDYSPNIRFADIDGSGTTDLVYGRAEQWKYMDLLGGVRPRLLTRVHNGLGATTTLTYASAAEDYTRDLQLADLCEGDCDGDEFQWSQVGPPRGKTLADAGPGDPACPWGDELLFERSGECVYRSGGSPVLSTVVRSVATTDNFQAFGREENVTRSEFHYHEGYYEGIEQEFRGFGAADAVAFGDVHHGTQHTRTFFHQGRRPSAIATSRLAENPYEALKGRQWYTETFDDNGAYLATAHGTVVARHLMTGLDGRVVWYAYVSQTDEFRYDHHGFVRGDAARELPWLEFQGVNAAGQPVVTESAYTWSVPVRSVRFAHIRGTTELVDNVGNVRQQTALGRIQDESDAAPPGYYTETIVSHTTPTLLAGGNWIWRTREAYITGDQDENLQLGHTTNRYTAATGDLEHSQARAELGYSPEHEFLGDDAGAAGYTVPTLQIVESSTRYDTWGSPVVTCASADLYADDEADCLRYAEVDYDDAYAQLPAAERIAVAGYDVQTFCAATTPFCMVETSATWDRGFGVMKTATDPNAETTTLAYDGLARLTAVTPPNFNDCSMTDVPVQTFRYDLVVDGRPVSRITALQNHGNAGCTAPAYIETVSYVDGLGRARAALARRADSEWERSGVTVFNARGTQHLGFQNDLVPGATPALNTVLGLPSSFYTEARYDAFGRVRWAYAEDRSPTETRYGATSTVVCDALDLSDDELYEDTCTITRVDGHGRTYDQVLHQRERTASQGFSDEYYRLYTLYRPDNAVALVVRGETTDTAPVEVTSVVDNHALVRVFHTDSLGRRVGSIDPDSDSADPSKDQTNRTWRYLYNDVGDLIAVRDPRGCGQNFFYDHAGRLIGEDYVECDEALHTGDLPVYPLPPSAIAEGPIGSGTPQYVDARYYFDEEPEFTGGFVTALHPTPHWVGRASGSVDRAQASVAVYDARGQAEQAIRIMSLLPEARSLDATLPEDLDDDGVSAAPAPGSQAFDFMNGYYTSTVYDNLGRPVEMTYPEVVDGTSVSNTTVRGRLSYNRLGLPTAVNLDVFFNGTGGTLAYSTPVVRNITYNEHRLPTRIDYGDATTTHDLHTLARYDERLRVLQSEALRDAPLGATGLNAVNRVHDFNYTWDAVSNLRQVNDARLHTEWTAGYRPWRQTIDHDALYRVTEIDIHYMDDTGHFNAAQTDLATDWRAERTRPNQDGSTHEARDPMRRRPAPMVSDNPPTRVRNLVYDYDWLANMTEWTDDEGVFYERSAGLLSSGSDAPDFVGNLTNGVSQYRPSALYLSTNISDAAGGHSEAPRGGYVWLDYGESGNVVSMTVHGQCHDRDETTFCEDLDPATSGFGDRKAALEAGCVCAQEQHYRYDWDELNRLAEARRYDRTGGAGVWTLAVQQRYRYDAGNVRMIKETIDHSASPFAAVTIIPYPGNFERRGLVLNTMDGTYDSSPTLNSESQYNVGGARLVWGADDPRSGQLTRSQRLTLPLSDLVQSTAAVVDLQSGDLIEHTTFYPNGARETHLSTDDVSMQLEPVGFTGKEADEEVGLVYFGERYLIPRLGRWASVDPLSVHAMAGGEIMNGYHYVGGNLLEARDPLGLAPSGPTLARRASHWRSLFATETGVSASYALANEMSERSGLPVGGLVNSRRSARADVERQEARNGPRLLVANRIIEVLSDPRNAAFVSSQLTRYEERVHGSANMDSSLVLAFATYESGSGVLTPRAGVADTYNGSGVEAISNAASRPGAFRLPAGFRFINLRRDLNDARPPVEILIGQIRANDELVAFAALLDRGHQNAADALARHGVDILSLSTDARRVWTQLGLRPGTMREIIGASTVDGVFDPEAVVSDTRTAEDGGLIRYDSIKVARAKAAIAASLDETIEPDRD